MSTPFPPPSSAPIYTTAPASFAPPAPPPKQNRRGTGWKVFFAALAVLILASVVVAAVASKKDTVATAPAPAPAIAYRTSTTNIAVPVSVKDDMWNDSYIATNMGALSDAFMRVARDASAGEVGTTWTDCKEGAAIIDGLRPHVAAYNSRAASLLLDALAIQSRGFDECIAGDFAAAGESFSRGAELTTQAAEEL